MAPLAPTDPKTGGKVNNVYFQPPSGVTLIYPCIVYSMEYISSMKADNRGYIKHPTYKLTYIDTRPDSNIPEKICDMPNCRMSNTYTADGLYHYPFNIYL